ncbi:MAG TPA: ATP-binding protein [Pyrinomonadaceae bacterium]|nr:ATP-binding protein [Pyrinomonadaceae bacterium]
MPADPKRIEADPTKDLFIQMLVKDIPLSRAIIDLVDNSVDGARALKGNASYAKLFVHLNTSKDSFTITDNCGGMPVAIAREYAFRFGRPTDMPLSLQTRHSVGQFGVGMKRAIFKMGRHFTVYSTTATSHFEVDENVDEWKLREKWDFRFKVLAENVKQPEKAVRGTTIKVTKLLPSVADDLTSDLFLKSLVSELADAHEINIGRGLEIKINGNAVPHKPPKLYSSPKVHPARLTTKKTEAKTKVDIVIYAGIFESNPDEGGWYVYCNGRLILRADGSITTGWGEKVMAKIPKYHPQFARFRGYTFLDSDNPALLPWNTTKTGVDADSVLYQGVRREMVLLMKPVIDLLNAMHREDRRPSKPLQTMVENMDNNEKTHVLLSSIKKNGMFTWPKPKEAPMSETVDIKYKRPKARVDKLKKFFKVRKASEVGEKTFDYVYKLEGVD